MTSEFTNDDKWIHDFHREVFAMRHCQEIRQAQLLCSWRCLVPKMRRCWRCTIWSHVDPRHPGMQQPWLCQCRASPSRENQHAANAYDWATNCRSTTCQYQRSWWYVRCEHYEWWSLCWTREHCGVHLRSAHAFPLVMWGFESMSGEKWKKKGNLAVLREGPSRYTFRLRFPEY